MDRGGSRPLVVAFYIKIEEAFVQKWTSTGSSLT